MAVNVTRRRFIQVLGVASGAAAAHRAMGMLGLLQATQPEQRRFKLINTGSNKGKQILILGAGLAGLGAAYELSKVGYDCRILEARQRPGGRCVTVRRGYVETEIDGKQQTASFDEGLYFNAGPTRIPQHHLTLDYCRELSVPIELFGNVNDAAYRYAGGKRTRLLESRARDAGYVAELLAKVARQDQLNQPITRAERDELMQLVRGPELRGDPETRQLVMFQIVGGVDRLASALAELVGAGIVYGAKVTEIRQRDSRVIVRYTDRDGRAQESSADLCICTIPPPVLKTIDADFSDETKRAIGSVQLASAAKVGLQFKRRFWEEDDKIFGGITQTDQCITQIMYPSYGWLGRKGLVVGCYNYGDDARDMGNRSFDQRIERTLAEGEKIHPQYRQEFETGFSMVWHRVPFSLGAWSTEGRANHLAKPDGRVYFGGEHLTHMGGWMAGALESARTIAEAVHARVQSEA